MHRRNFVKLAGTSVTGGNLLAKAPKEKDITLGFELYGMKVLKTDDALRILDEIGFDSVEFTVWDGWDASPANLSKSRRKDLRGLLGELNLRLTSFMENLTPDNDQKHRATRIERLKVAAQLGQEFVTRFTTPCADHARRGILEPEKGVIFG